MLTKNLLRFNLHHQKLCPRFLDTQNKIWQKLSEALAHLYETGRGQSREELADLAQPILNNARSPLMAKGLNKLLLDRCTFQEADDALETFRMKVFTTAAQTFYQHPTSEPQTTSEPSALPLSGTNNLEKFRQAVAESMDMALETLSSRLYADLSSRQLLRSFKPINPEKLLHRYNMALAQGPLIYANSLNIEMEEPDIGVRRKFFHHLKFHRLLARISQKQSGQFSIQVDGPLSLFDNNRKYGLQLAYFLPSVCALRRWHIHANVCVNPGEPATLELDQDTGLKSHLSQTSTYVPEEFEQFAAQFDNMEQAGGKKSTRQETLRWKIKKNTPLLNLGDREWVVPDFSFRHDSGQIVHLELFHRWHTTPLLRRIQSLQKRKQPLALGVDRFLTKNAQTKATLQQSEWYQQHGFPFNGFPTVKRVTACLNGFLEETPKAKGDT